MIFLTYFVPGKKKKKYKKKLYLDSEKLQTQGDVSTERFQLEMKKLLGKKQVMYGDMEGCLPWLKALDDSCVYLGQLEQKILDSLNFTEEIETLFHLESETNSRKIIKASQTIEKLHLNLR